MSVLEEMKEPGNLYELKREFEELTDSRAWRILVKTLQEQADSMQNEIIFAPVLSEADVYRQERMKGQLEGRLSLQNTVQTLIETLAVDIHTAQQRKED